MKYSRTALGLLNAQYRSVLRKCMLINLGLFAITAIAATPANAEVTVLTGVGTTTVNNVATSTDGSTVTGTTSIVGVDTSANTTATVYTKTEVDGLINALDAVETQTAGTDGLSLSITQTDGKILSISGAIAANTYDSYGTASGLVNALDAVETQTAGADGLSLSITQTDGKIMSISGAIAANTYDSYGTASGLVNALDAVETQTAGTDGLSLKITQIDGKITAVEGAITANTYDAYGAASTAKTEILAGTGYTSSGLETAVKGTKVNSATSADTATTATSADSATTLTGLTASIAELNYVDGVTSNIQTQLDGKTTLDAVKTAAQSTDSGSLGATITSKANSAISDSVADTTTAGALGTLLAGKQATIDSTNTLDSAFINTTNYANSALETAVKGTKVNSATSADSATTLTGLTASVEELNYVDGVTSNIQTQLDGKTTLDAVKTDAASTTAGSLGATITSKANSAISTALGTGGDIATYVTNNAVQTVTAGTANGTISVDGGADVLIYNDADVKAEIAKRDVTISGGIATIKDGTDTAQVYTKDQADTKFVGAAANNTFTGTNTFSGAVTMSSGLSITGGTLTAGASTLGATTVNSLTTTGAIQGATLTTSGLATVDSLSVTNGASVGGALSVTGNETVGGTLTVTGMTNANGGLTTSDLELGGASLTGADTGASAVTTGSANTVATTATVLKSAENATFSGTPLTGKSASTVKAALTDANVAINTLNGGANDSGSVLNSVKTTAQNADFTAGGSTVLSGQTQIGSAINTLGTAVDTINTAITVTTNGNYIKATETAAGNLGLLDSALKANADKDGIQDTSLTNLYTAVNGGTYNKDTGAVTGATALSGFTATNLTAAANELMTDIKVAANGNYITAGADVKGNLGALDTAIGKVATGTYNAISASNNVAANLQALDSAFTSGTIDASFDDTTVTTLKIGDANKISGSADTIDMNKNSLTNVKGLTLTDGTNTGSLTVDADSINTDKSLDVNGSLFVGSADQFVVDGSGNVTTSGDISAKDGTFSGGLDVTGDASIGGDLDVTGTANVGALEIGTTGYGITSTGAATFASTDTASLTVGSANAITSTAAGVLNMGGNDLTNIKDLTTTGNATIGGTLNAGATTIYAEGTGVTTALSVTAKNTTDSSQTSFAVASDKATVTGNLDVSGTLGVGANTKMAENDSINYTSYGSTSPATGQKVLEVSGVDAMAVDGKIAATNGLSVATKSGTTYTEVFNVDNTGSISSDMLKTDNGGNTVTIGKDTSTVTTMNGSLKFNAGSESVNAIDDGTTAQTTGGANTMATVATVLKSAENGAYTGASDKNIAADSTIKTAIGALDTEIGADDDYGTGALNNGVVGTATVKANIAAINDKLGNIPDTAVNGYDMSAAGATLVGAVNKLDTNMEGVLGGIYNQTTGAYDNTALLNDTTPNGFETGATNLSDALTKYAENNQAAMGTTYAADGSFTNNYAQITAVDYAGVTTDKDLVKAISQINTNIGAGTALGTITDRTTAAANNGVAATNTVNANIVALNDTIGDLTGLNTTLGNLTNGDTKDPTTVVRALNNIDATLGKIHGLVANADDTTTTTGVAYYGNLAVGTTVEEHIEAVDAAIGDRRNLGSKNEAINTGTKASVAAGIKAAGDAIGDMNFAQAHYVASENDLSGAVRSLDSNLYRVESDLHDLKRDFNRGMASMAAMSALVPNPRAHGNTSLAIGTGAYSGHTATAIGGFHYLTDNIMLNAGAAWGNSRDVSYRMGVTFSW